MRTNLEALIHRNVFYQLVELAVSREIEGQRWLGVWSGGEFFRTRASPRSVISSGSPGPAPTNDTVMTGLS